MRIDLSGKVPYEKTLWTRYFAWCPRITNDGQLVWLEWAERRKNLTARGDIWQWELEYRLWDGKESDEHTLL